MVEGVTMVTMPVDFCPSPLVVELPPLLCSEGVVSKKLLNVGVEDVTPKNLSFLQLQEYFDLPKKYGSHQTLSPGAESRPC